MLFERLNIIDVSVSVREGADLLRLEPPFETTVAVVYDQLQKRSADSFAPEQQEEEEEDEPESALTPYVGPALVLDIAPFEDEEITGAILVEALRPFFEEAREMALRHNELMILPKRLIVKTRADRRPDAVYPYFTLDAVAYLYANDIALVGTDTPSIGSLSDPDRSVEQFLEENRISWLVNLDLTAVTGHTLYMLSAAPMKVQNARVCPARAILFTN